MYDNLQNSRMDRGRDWSWRFAKIVDCQQHGWDIKYLFSKSSLGVCVSDILCTVCSCKYCFLSFFVVAKSDSYQRGREETT